MAYHLAFFTAINPLAYGFTVLFMVGATVFFWQGVVCRKLIFKITTDLRIPAGWSLIIFAWFIYPAWTYFVGHLYPAIFAFGLPCPTTLFAIGLLAFFVKPYPRSVLIVEVLWCFVGSQAAFLFDVQAYLGLIVVGVLDLVLIVQAKASAPAAHKASSK